MDSFSGSYWNIEGKCMDTADGCTIYDMQSGDIYGDHRPDTVFLIGKKAGFSNSVHTEKLSLIIQDCRTGMHSGIPLNCSRGHRQKLFLGDFNNDDINEILVMVYPENRTAPGEFYVFSYKCTMLRKLFDSGKFNEEKAFRVAYLDGYKVDVTDSQSKGSFRIDVSSKSLNDLSQVYNSEGRLVKPACGQVLGLSRLYPIAADDNFFSLLALQAITGAHKKDILGYIQSLLTWNGKEIAVQKTGVSIDVSP